MAAPKHKTKADREAYLSELSICYRKGWSGPRMAEKFGKSTRMIRADCRLLDQRFLENQVSNVAHRRATEVAKIDLVEGEAWNAWDKSREDAEVRTQKMRKAEAGAQGMPVEATIRTEAQAGDPAYLRLVLESIRDRRKVQGTDRPERSSTDDYSGMTDDEIDARIVNLERLEALERGEAGPAGTPAPPPADEGRPDPPGPGASPTA